MLAEQRGHLQPEAALLAQGAQRLDVPLAVAAQREVRPDQQDAQLELFDEERQEVLVGELRQFRGEGEHAYAVDAQRSQESYPLLKRAEVRGGCSRAEDGDGVRIEGDDDAGQILRTRLLQQQFD